MGRSGSREKKEQVSLFFEFVSLVKSLDPLKGGLVTIPVRRVTLGYLSLQLQRQEALKVGMWLLWVLCINPISLKSTVLLKLLRSGMARQAPAALAQLERKQYLHRVYCVVKSNCKGFWTSGVPLPSKVGASKMYFNGMRMIGHDTLHH